MNSLRHYIDLTFYKSYAELRAEATRGYLGFLWWFLEPLLYMGVFYLVFETGLRRGGDGYVGFLLCGLVPWKWFASTVLGSANVVGKNASLIQQVYLPKLMLPGVVVASNTFKFLLVTAILLILLLLLHVPVTAAWAMLPVLMLIELLLICGLAALVAAVVPMVQDLKLLLDNLMMMLFFLSGIFFDISQVPPDLQKLLFLNPMAVLIESYRQILLHGTLPDLVRLAGVVVIALAALAAGSAIMIRYDRDYPRLVTK